MSFHVFLEIKDDYPHCTKLYHRAESLILIFSDFDLDKYCTRLSIKVLKCRTSYQYQRQDHTHILQTVTGHF